MFQAATKKLQTRLLNVFSQHDTGIATGIIRLSNRTRPTRLPFSTGCGYMYISVYRM